MTLLLLLAGRIIADETAEPRPDMYNKVAAFTVSGKSINTYMYTCIIYGLRREKTSLWGF